MRSEVVKVEMCRDHGCGKYAHVDGNASGLLAKLLPDMKVGETRNVRVTVEFVETPRERLRREFIESQNKVMPEQHKHLYAVVMNYLAATEGEG